MVTPLGIGTEQTWQALLAGKNGVGPITQFDASAFSSRIAAEVKGFDPLNWIEKKEVKKMGRFIHFAIAAADFATKMAGLTVAPEESERVGAYVGSGVGGFDVIEREHRVLMEGGPRKVSPFFIPGTIVNLAAGHLSIRHNAKGPNLAAATACSASAHAVGDSFRLIQRNDVDVMICGGAEAAITGLAVGGFAAMRALSTRNDDPEHASRPFDKERDGFVMGEGSGILVMEELEHARRRGARILAEIVGYGASADAFHITMPCEDGEGAANSMRHALADAGVTPAQVGYINAHGTSTPYNDKFETIAIKRTFGEHAYKVPISSTKSMTGHLLGAAGGVEAGISILALVNQVLPPTMNYQNPDPDCDLDYVPNQPRQARIEYVLSNSFGFGGTNASLLFKRWQE